MALLLDSRTLPVKDRIEAVSTAMSSTEVPQHIGIDDTHGEPWHRLDTWDLGGGAHLLRHVGTGIHLQRTPRHLRLAAPERIAIGHQIATPATYHSTSHDQDIPPGHIHLVDQTRPYDYTWHGTGGSKAVIIDTDRLALPIDVIRAAAPHLHTSPVYNLFRTHLDALARTDTPLPPEPARTMIRNATIELLRALITTAAHDTTRATQTMNDTLHWRISHYITQHLQEPTLTPEHIAHAHNISIRQLYKIWSTSTTTLSETIMQARLEATRNELANPTTTTTTIAAIARHWGFTDATHFSRRFRAAYGTTPREWQKLNRQPTS